MSGEARVAVTVMVREGSGGLSSWRRSRSLARAASRALPGVGVTGLCAAVVATLVLPGVLRAPPRAPGGQSHRAAPAKLASTSTKLPSHCQASSTRVTCVFTGHGTRDYTDTTNGNQPVHIPTTVETVTVQANGAIGGGEGHGNGGIVTAKIHMTKLTSRTLRVVAGGNGKGTTTGGTGGAPGGGSGGSGHTRHGSGGGGITGVALATGSNPYATPLVIAGAGGGTGSYGSGNGWSYAGSGGSSGTGGNSGSYTWCFGKDVGGGGGGGASQTSGGGGGSSPNGCSPGGGGGGGGALKGGNGGNGAGAAGSGGGGGGGGAGWYGGGGGGGGGTDGSGGGGGGGSSNVHGTAGWVTTAAYTGASTGYAYLALSWPLRPTSTSLTLSAGPPKTTVPAGFESLTLTATLTSSTRGTVDFRQTDPTGSPIPDSTGSCTTVTITSHSASCTFRAPATLGSHTYAAAFLATSAFAASTGRTAITVVHDTTTMSTVRVTPTTTAGVKLVVTVTVPSYASDTIGGGTVTFYQQAPGTPTKHEACSQTISSGLTAGHSANIATGAPVTCPRFTGAIPGDTYTLTAAFTPPKGTTTDNTKATTKATYQYKVAKATPTVTLSVSPASVSFGQKVTLQATVSGLPSADRPPATVTYEGPGGTPIACTGTGQQNPAPVTTGNGVTSPCTFTPGTGGTASTETVVAAYAGDAETNPSKSTSERIAVSKASSTTVVTATPTGGVGAVGVPVTLTARVSDGTDPTAVAGGTVEFEQRTTGSGQTVAVAGCAARKATDGVASCTLPTAPATLATLTFGAVYCPTGTTGACTDWIKSTAKPVTYTPVKDPTAVTLTPAGTQTHPETVTTSTLTVTATVAMAVPTSAQTPALDGTVGFQENGQPIGGSCATVAVSGGSGQATCTFSPVPGAEDAVTATFAPASGSLVTGVTSAPAYFKVAGVPTATTLTVTPPSGDPLEYGVPLTATATVTSTVTSKPAAVTAGTVAFAVDGSPVPSCASQAVSHQGTATCTLPPLAAGTPHDVTATFAYAGGTYQRSTGTTSVTVTSAPTTTGLALSPDVTTPADDQLTATVTNSAPGARAPPTGTVGFSTAAGPVPSCSAVPLVAGSGPTATATCDLARPTSAATYEAAFSPTPAADFTPSTSAPLAFTPGGSCSTAFQNAWNEAGKSLALSVGGASLVGDLSVDLGSPVGTCSPTRVLPFSGGTLQLFGHTLAGTSAITGYLVDAQGAGATPEVCVTGGTLHLPSSWSLGTVALSSTEKLCFDLTSVSGTSGTVGGVSGALTVSAATLPFGLPAGGYQLGISFAAGGTSTMSVHLGPPAPPATTPYATATLTVTDSGGTFSVAGEVVVGNLPFLSGQVQATLTATTGTTGKITWSVSLGVPATRTYTPVPGLTLKGLSLKLSSSSGLTVGATAVLGTGTSVAVALTGSYSAGKWTLTLKTTAIGPWSPIAGLTLSATLSGTLTVTTAGPTTAVSYDFGTAASKTLASWTLGAGFQATVDCVAFAFGETPACAPGLLTTDPTDPTVVLQGSVTFNGVTAGFQGSLDLKTRGIQFSLLHSVTVSPVAGVTVTLTTLAFSGTPGTAGSLSVVAKGQAVVPVLGATAAHPLTASLTDHGGSLVVAIGGISLRSLGVPLTGLFAYASSTVTTFTAGPTLGKVTLAKGFDGFAVYHPTGGVVSVLQTVGFNLPAGDAVTFTASWTPGASPTFTATLAAPSGGVPFLAVPGGGAVTGASLSYAAGQLKLELTGTIPVPGSAPATISLAFTVGTNGTFSGSATVSNLTVFGQTVGLVGTLTRKTGTVTASISSCQPTAGGCTKGPIAGPFSPFPGVPFQLSTVSFSLGTAGLSVAATMSVHTLGDLSVTGTLKSLSTWSIVVKAAAARTWTPVTGVTLAPAFAGTVTDASGSVSFALTASGVGGKPLLTLSPTGVTVSVTSVGLGDAAPPKGCTAKKLGDLWLSVSGSLGLSLAGASGTVAATGCFDLTAGNFTLTAAVTSLSFSALTGHLSFGAPTVVVSETTGTFQAKVDATLTVTMPSGGSLIVRATVDFESGGNFVIGAEVNLSQWLGTTGDTAYLYYASEAVSGFTTGDPTLHKIALTLGLTFALAISLPTSVVTGLNHIGIHLPAGTGFTAVGTADFSTDTYRLTVSVSLGTGVQLFTASGTRLLLDTGFLQVTLSPSNVQFGVGLTATLHVPPPGSGDRASTVRLTGELTVSTTGVNVSMSLGRCGTTATAWFTAFGASGLTIQCAALQGGITFEPPFVNVGLDGTITSLPSVISKVTGYQTGAPITFAFNLDPFLLELSIGTKNSTTPALEPLSFITQGTLIKVYYASLYISPQGAKIGTTSYPAGISMGFQATLFSVKVSILATIGLSPPSITFTATISKITVGPLSVGPVSVVLKASPTNFEFRFTGTATLGPGSTNIGTDLKVGGKLSASVQVTLSKSGFSAFIWGTMALTVTVYVGQTTCWTSGFIPYTCNYHWAHTGFSATLAKTGFSVTSTGVTLEADGYSVTFNYSGSVSVSTAFVRPAQHGHGTVPMDLAATRQPVDPATGAAIPKKGVAVLVPTSSGGTPRAGTPTASGGTQPGTPSIGAAPVGAGSTLGRWTGTGSLPAGRVLAAVSQLHDGDVLVAGGLGTGKSVLSSADVYDPTDGTWSPVGTLNTARVGASAVVLGDGDVLVAGGYGPDHQPLRTAELYDPSTGTFSRTGSMTGARAYVGAALLPDGDVLVLGGEGPGHVPLATAELYDPSTGTFSATGSLAAARAFPAVATLPGGGVLAAGGTGNGGTLATAERYDPSTGSWSPAGRMSTARTMSSAVVLRGGDVLVVGDSGAADRYDPTTGTWTSTQGMAVVRTMPTVAALPDGKVLVAGGQSMGTSVATAEVYEPSTMAWLGAGTMSTVRAGAATAVLSNGQVLVAGGGDITAPPGGKPTVQVESSAQLYAGPTASNGKPPRQAAAPVGTIPPPVGFPLLPLVVALAAGAAVLSLPAGLLVERRRRRRRPAGSG